jgi:hypothetical protein
MVIRSSDPYYIVHQLSLQAILAFCCVVARNGTFIDLNEVPPLLVNANVIPPAIVAAFAAAVRAMRPLGCAAVDAGVAIARTACGRCGP